MRIGSSDIRRRIEAQKSGRLTGKTWRVLFVVSVILLVLCMSGCGGGGGDSSGGGSSGGKDSKKEAGYKAPKFKDASFNEGEAQEGNGAAIDLSSADEGYVAVSANSGSRLKFQVIKGDDTYTYDIDSDGTPSVFPLQCGDGTYQFKVMENIVDNKYAEMYTTSKDVSLKNEFQPFLRPSDYVDYSKKSECVEKAKEIAAKAESEVDVVAGVYDYVCKNVTYDDEKAATVQSGYLPDPDETMRTGKGICFDYASLAAALLRSQGIPCKVVFGYVAPDDLYHAWNMFYTKETGWVTVGFEVDKKNWTRMDLTFSANGADSEFIGDGSHYSDVYVY